MRQQTSRTSDPDPSATEAPQESTPEAVEAPDSVATTDRTGRTAALGTTSADGVPGVSNASTNGASGASVATSTAGVSGASGAASMTGASEASGTASKIDAADDTGANGASTDAGEPENGSATVSEEDNQSITIGQRDRNGHVVTDVYCRTRKYIIWEADNVIWYVLPDSYTTANAMRSRIAALGGLRASIENLRSEPSIGDLERRRAGQEMAWALGLAFDEASTVAAVQAKEILTRVDARLRSLVKSHCRKQYAFANLQAFAGIEFILLLFVAALDPGVASGTRLAMLHYAIFGMFGALGALLSVISGLKSLEIDINLGRWEHLFSGATRITIGLIGAWIVALALDSALVDPTFGHAAEPSSAPAPSAVEKIGFSSHIAMYLIFAFIGGFSQTLVPSLLQRGEDAAGGKETPPTAPIKPADVPK